LAGGGPRWQQRSGGRRLTGKSGAWATRRPGACSGVGYSGGHSIRWNGAAMLVTPSFRKINQVYAYMCARIKFHTYSRHKWITVTVSHKEHKQNLQNLSELYSSILETEAPTPPAID
jgi:hypothetical protein